MLGFHKGVELGYDTDPTHVAQLRLFLEKIAEGRAVLARQQTDIAAIVGELDTLKAQCSQLLRRKERAVAGA